LTSVYILLDKAMRNKWK